MSPSQNGPLWAKSKYAVLTQGDEILATDQYYNPIKDKWLPVEREFVGQLFDDDHSKPVRRVAGRKTKDMAKVAFDKLEIILNADYYHPLPEDAGIGITAVQAILHKHFIKR